MRRRPASGAGPTPRGSVLSIDAVSGHRAWRESPLAFAFWAMNIGLILEDQLGATSAPRATPGKRADRKTERFERRPQSETGRVAGRTGA